MDDITGSYNLGFVVAGALNVAASIVLAFIPLAKHSIRQTERSIINVTIDHSTQEITRWTDNLPPIEVTYCIGHLQESCLVLVPLFGWV